MKNRNYKAELGHYAFLLDDAEFIDFSHKPTAIRFKGGGASGAQYQKEQAAAEKEQLQNTDMMLALYEEVFAPTEKQLLYQSMGVTDPSRLEPLDSNVNDAASKLGEIRNSMTDLQKIFTDSGVATSEIPTSIENVSALDSLKLTGDKKKDKALTSAIEEYKTALQQHSEAQAVLTEARAARNQEINTQNNALVGVQSDIAKTEGLAYATQADKSSQAAETRSMGRYGIDTSKLDANTQGQLESARTLSSTTNRVNAINSGLAGAKNNRDALVNNTIGLGAGNSAAANQLRNQASAYNNASATAYQNAYNYGQQAIGYYGQIAGTIGQTAGLGLGYFTKVGTPGAGSATTNTGAGLSGGTQ